MKSSRIQVFLGVLAVIIGFGLGSAANMGIITISGDIIPPPEGADVTTMEGLKESMHLFQPKHFLLPFLAHALGTFVGAFVAAIISPIYKFQVSILIGIIFLLAGILNIILLPSPFWFSAVDLIGAYLPFAFLGGKLGTRRRAG